MQGSNTIYSKLMEKTYILPDPIIYQRRSNFNLTKQIIFDFMITINDHHFQLCDSRFISLPSESESCYNIFRILYLLPILVGQ